ncbi:MAG: response regulator transcription factor [Alphaproteobacteria bacterium]|nr:response regulator transcription factor [Alphaproteobacteria bacterium]
MRVLIADDHALVRAGLSLVLKGLDPDVVIDQCGNAADALSLAAHSDDFDLAIFDLMMPGMNGMEGLEAFQAQSPDVPVLVLTGFTRHKDALAAFDMGVAGYASKGLETESMANAIRLVLSGDRYFPANLLVGSCCCEEAAAHTALLRLSERENEILTHLMDGSTNKEIGRHLDIEEVTVKLHLSNIYRKLGVTNRTQAVRFALDHGWQG